MVQLSNLSQLFTGILRHFDFRVSFWTLAADKNVTNNEIMKTIMIIAKYLPKPHMAAVNSRKWKTWNEVGCLQKAMEVIGYPEKLQEAPRGLRKSKKTNRSSLKPKEHRKLRTSMKSGSSRNSG